MKKLLKGDKMTIWNRFTAWLSGWPESKHRKSEKEQIYLFEEEEIKKQEQETQSRKTKKPKGLKPKKKKVGDKK